ncbi:hypothetical protein [Salinigranum sp. GCM10025319]|uniref:hypothetical protein n=1 Tax=Salinigranum sp. GCM10025319 TaxID=3252687 RepID=UPI003609A694
MGSDSTRRGRRDVHTPEPPEITTDAIRDMFERAFATDERESESEPMMDSVPTPPEPPEITDADVWRMIEGWGFGEDDDETDSTTTTPMPAAGSTPILREVQCPSCYGSGTQLCSSCYGSGYQTTSYTTTDWEGNVEYVTDQYPCGCSGGSVACGACSGRGVVYR